MSDFIQRLQKLEEARKQHIAEKNRLEASISVQEEMLNEFKKELEEKGIVYESLEELQEEIAEREQVLEEKVSNIENRTAISEQEPVRVQPSQTSSDFDLDIDM